MPDTLQSSVEQETRWCDQRERERGPDGVSVFVLRNAQSEMRRNTSTYTFTAGSVGYREQQPIP